MYEHPPSEHETYAEKMLTNRLGHWVKILRNVQLHVLLSILKNQQRQNIANEGQRQNIANEGKQDRLFIPQMYEILLKVPWSACPKLRRNHLDLLQQIYPMIETMSS
jgi:hypothetical protein